MNDMQGHCVESVRGKEMMTYGEWRKKRDKRGLITSGFILFVINAISATALMLTTLPVWERCIIWAAVYCLLLVISLFLRTIWKI